MWSEPHERLEICFYELYIRALMVCKATFHFFFTFYSPIGRHIFEIIFCKKANLHLSVVVSGSYFFSKFLFLFSMLDRRLLSVWLGQIFYWIAICFCVEPGVHKWLTSVYVKPIPCEQTYWARTFQMICINVATQD